MSHIRIDRLMADIEGYASIGRQSGGGITRPCFSTEDNLVREKFSETLRHEGLDVHIDGAANVWGRLPGTGQRSGSLVVGSHLDTVPNGGAYDGALGVLMALELVRTLREQDIKLDHDLEIVSFTGEEPNDFRVSTMGSRCFTGKLTPESLADVRHSQGRSLRQAMEDAGGAFDEFDAMWAQRANKKAFLELHIEQGRRLVKHDLPVAVVDSIVGIYREQVTVTGSANHAGTTMMDERADALMAAAEMGMMVEEVCRAAVNDSVGTVGKLDIRPNAANIIPGEVDFILELRNRQPEQIRAMRTAIHDQWTAIAKRRGVSIRHEPILDQAPVFMDPEMVEILERSVRGRGIGCLTLPSMAGHDASHMASVAKTAMIFVRSPNGKSHCPDEFSTREDIAIAGNVMLDALLRLDALS